MSKERALRLAIELQLLGVSQRGVVELLRDYPYDLIERQLAYLPYRKKPRRPEAFIVEAIRNNYSPPKAFFHATPPTPPSCPASSLDKNSKPHH